MADFSFNEMQAIQKELQEQHKNIWAPLEPRLAREQLLWMLIEAGEIADIIKKKGDDAIMNDSEIRHDFIEEMCDTLMFFNDVMLCYQITPEELKQAYYEKFDKNLGRW